MCAGGTGGGIYPALAAVAELERLGLPKENILWVGVRGEMEERLVPRAGLRLERIEGGPMVGVPKLTTLKNGLKLAWSAVRGAGLMRQFGADVVFVTGGYMSVPIAVAAKWRRIPALVFLPDVEPGTAIKRIGRVVSRVAATFQESESYFEAGKTIATGYPVRAELREAAQMPKAAALAQFELTDERPTLFVFGGSRGAWSINQAIMQNLPALLAEMQVIHVSGTLTWEKVAAFAETLPQELRRFYRPYAYLHGEMGAAFRAGDVVLARAGASMLGEAPLFGIPAILVPYPYAWRYQKVNADYLVARGAAVRLNDEDLEAKLLATVRGMVLDEKRRQEMSAASAKLAQPEGARRLANVLLEMGGGV